MSRPINKGLGIPGEQYDNREKWKIVDRFDSSYWSGQDLRVYVDNIYLDEAIQLNYQIVEQVRAYYGYASYTPDRFHHGTRIISGELSLNFKRDGYIFSLLQAVRTGESNVLPNLISSRLPGSNPGTITPGLVRPEKPFMFNSTSSEALSVDKLKQSSIPPEVLRAYVDAMKSPEADEDDVNAVTAVVPENFGIFETRIEGFDINVILGGTLKAGAVLRYNANNSYYGDNKVNQDRVVNVKAGTGFRIVGASIVGLARSLGDDGRPYVETYTFQARDIQLLDTTDLQKD